MAFNLADLFEGVVDAVPDREALVLGAGGHAVDRLTYAELDERSNRWAHVLRDRGIRPGDHVGLHLHNGRPHIEAMLALYKLRATPVNVNYRYVVDELRYLFDDADLRGIVTEPDLRPLVDAASGGLPDPSRLLVVEPGEGLEAELAGAPAERPDVGPRSADDLYLLYTGGTTGRPKGVMWRHEDIFFASLGGRGTPSRGIPALTAPDQIGARARRGESVMRRLPLCPLMHGGAMWVALQTFFSGGALVLATDRRFDAAEALDLLAGERVELTMLIGDATARPLADHLASAPGRYDLSALQVIASGGAILSPAVKAALLEQLPHTKVVDTFGASETGGQGRLRATASGARLLTDEDTAVFDDDLRPLAPGTGVIGRLGRTGYIPYGYYKDPGKTAATFPVIDGVRWSVPGDFARVEVDGSITLLGRGSMSINTGGEKVFPEEVEGVIKSHPAVFDAMVVGVPDERFGQRVVGVVSLRTGAPLGRGAGSGDGSDAGSGAGSGAGLGDGSGDELGEVLAAHARQSLSGYKVPRAWVVVDECRRLPTGKPDYRWAADTAAQASAGQGSPDQAGRATGPAGAATAAGQVPAS